MKHWILIVGSVLAMVLISSTATWAHFLDNTQVRIALHAKGHYPVSKEFPTLCSWNPVNADNIDCTQFNTAWTTNDFPGPHVYVVAGQGGPQGILGISFGVDYDGSPGVGIDPQFVQFTLCTDGEMFPNPGPNGEFPAPGGGICLNWTTCQNSPAPTGYAGVHAAIGVFYVYAYSAASLWITPNNNLPDGGREFAVTDCSYNTVNILDLTDPSLEHWLGGRVDFGGGPGYTPCGLHEPWGHAPFDREKNRLETGPASTFCGTTPTRRTTWGVIKDQYRSKDKD